MATLQYTQDEEKQLQQLQSDLKAQPTTTTESVGGEICEAWNKYKKYWPILIGIVRRVPKYGTVLALLLEKIGQLLDATCGGADDDDLGLSSEDKASLDELQNDLGGQAGTAEAVSVADICEYWRKYEKYWPILIKIVGRIPKYGDAIASLLEKIGKLLDTYCTNK
jgi:hypothetical protein